jgi:hypothetical protein
MRRRKILLALLALVILLGVATAWVAHVPPEDLARAKEANAAVFDRVRSSTDWNLEGDLLWGYFFTSGSKAPLVLLSWVLPLFGYRTVDFTLQEDGKLWWLHSEHIQTNSLESISLRDVRFNRLAGFLFNSDFDGWDVGRAPDQQVK